jgi:hypothetical protein
MLRKDEYRIYAELLQLHPSKRRDTHPTWYWGCSHAKGELQRRRAKRAPKASSRRTFLSNFTSPEQSYAAASQSTPTKSTAGRGEKRPAPLAATSATTGISQNRSVSTGSQFVWHWRSSHCSAPDHDRAQWNSIKSRQNNGHYKNGT